MVLSGSDKFKADNQKKNLIYSKNEKRKVKTRIFRNPQEKDKDGNFQCNFK